MAADDDISAQLIDGDAYDIAKVTVRQTFRIPVDRKIAIAIVGLGLSSFIAPLFMARSDFVRTLETGVAGDGLSPAIGLFALYGIGVTFAAGCVLLRQRALAATESLNEEQARRLVRIEDLIMWFVAFGVTCIAIPLIVGGIGLVSPGTVELLYELGVFVYRPSETISIDIRFISATGGFAALVLLILFRLAPARS